MPGNQYLTLRRPQYAGNALQCRFHPGGEFGTAVEKGRGVGETDNDAVVLVDEDNAGSR